MKINVEHGILGYPSVGKTTGLVEEITNMVKEKDSPTVIVVDEQQLQQRIIEVNGVQYVEKPKQKQSSGYRKLPILQAYVDQFLEMEYSKTRQLPDDVDIVKEYGLIEHKTCKLPRW